MRYGTNLASEASETPRSVQSRFTIYVYYHTSHCTDSRARWWPIGEESLLLYLYTQ